MIAQFAAQSRAFVEVTLVAPVKFVVYMNDVRELIFTPRNPLQASGRILLKSSLGVFGV